jgi:bifunctional NMN adenylyltransferase/nudix hydrolase
MMPMTSQILSPRDAAPIPVAQVSSPSLLTELWDMAVFIGRTQPPTVAHIECIRRALGSGRHAVMLSGSAFQARSQRNMLFFSERAALLRGALTAAENERLDIVPLPDCYSDKQWQLQVRRCVREICMARGFGTRARICLVGHAKDASSYYLNMFPGWDAVETGGFNDISATPAREDFLGREGDEAHAAVARWAHILPENVQAFLHEFADSEGYAWLMGEIEWERQHRTRQAAQVSASDPRHAWQPSPIVTTETVVFQSGHVLLARRLKRPGLGLLSLPGDLLRTETFVDGALRVLVDEHRLMVQPTRKPEMARSLLADKMGATVVFDHPYRSSRGHLVTGCHLLELRADKRGLAPIGPGSQTEQPLWMAVDEVNPEEMFEDRFHLMNHMLQR